MRTLAPRRHRPTIAVPGRAIAAVLVTLLAGAWIAGAATVAPNPGIKTIILVRHAEKDTTVAGTDPPLSPDGRLRAQELVRVMGDTPVRAVYCTPYLRTRLTAEPLARHAGDSLTVIRDVDATLRALRAEPWGSTVVVVAHSNTLPQIAQGLLGRPFPDSARVGYDGLWIVTLARDGTGALMRMHYGASAAFVR